MVIIAITTLLTSPTFSPPENNLEAYELKASNLGTPTTETEVISIEIKAQADNRATRLKKFLAANSSPMTKDADNLVKIADKYELDWKLLPAIAGVESTFGRFVPSGSYNAYGWHNGKYYFNSWTSASEQVAKGIKIKWSSMGEITPWKIGPYYAENPNWALRVNHYMGLIQNYK
ncbi:MAG: hypothetical protein A2Z11_04350 [Candidatus Woykebacteria bacterium RBG_16_43_9]|uniref:Mannosyl-glycoprotein endo-beta-N-acetylglucosamidase-like domain-containing protein n=1 Tax=Candidatus Woykebacteria bacterium RBG_16_43_9 TaxID=1802596 RepID=A0A1G1WG97_9BACT|nr:MAG: hypothetical protein A2Z11_04350 [Candidatus Woykebacteria bacterium RBG_16_43_9]